MGFERPCILPFVNKLKAADPDIFIIEIKFQIGINRMTDIHTLPDIGRGNLEDISLEADSGVIVYYPFVSDQKNFIQLGF